MKQIIVHIGPHKTGSTSIQQCLTANQSQLKAAGILFLHNSQTHEAALSLARDAFEEAEQQLGTISQTISKAKENRVILSQEDFCGELPGRSMRKTIYPKLTKNLRIIWRALQPNNVTFAFFIRDEDEFLASCYHQHLKHRTQFSNFAAFKEHFGQNFSWAEELEKPKETFKDSLFPLPYVKSPEAGVRAILSMVGKADMTLSHHPDQANASPAPDLIRQLERINALTESKATAWFAKSLILRGWTPKKTVADAAPPFRGSPDLASLALPELTRRALDRVTKQAQVDILPDHDAPLAELVFDILPKNVELQAHSRIDIRDQSRSLDYHLRGKSSIAKLNALTISYLRRDTAHTAKAKHLFHRVWAEHGTLLVNELSTRWLISTLQTFLDHGLNEAQRMIGTSGYFYANMLKIYEGERAIENRAQDGTYEETGPRTNNKFTGLDRYNVGGTDLLLNTNALALDLSMRDDVAGVVLQEFLLRVKSYHNVFTRMDRTRQEKGVVVSGFEDTWSFFTPPSKI